MFILFNLLCVAGFALGGRVLDGSLPCRGFFGTREEVAVAHDTPTSEGKYKALKTG